MNASLTPELEKFVADTVATGRYNSASEVIRAALRKLEEEEQWKVFAKSKIQKGLEDAAAGRTVSRGEFIANMDKRVRAREKAA